jgi:hypothetical protein
MVFVLILSFAIFAQEEETAPQEPAKEPDINVGNISIPSSFIHAGKNYDKGVYYVILTAKEGVPYFNVHNQKKELLFEEMAVVKPNTSRAKFTYRVKRGFLANHEYFRVKVIKPDAQLIAFLLVKEEKEPQPAEKKEETKESKEIYE